MSIWPQRGIGYAFSIKRSVGQPSRIHSSQRSIIQSLLPSVYSCLELPKRSYASNEKYTKRERTEKEDNVNPERRTPNQTGSSTLVHQQTNPQATQFFSPRLDRIIDEEALKSLLNHCDRAIVLSRGSSDTNTFWTAKDHLFQATRIYVDLVKRASLKSDIDVLSYETYLIRSGYAHVIRTIGALIGRDGVIVCARMMQDLLQWEVDLLEMDFESADGSDVWRKKRKKKRSEEKRANQKPLNLDQKEEIIIEESLLSSGPFLQDLTPICYDIFNDLTSERVEPSSFQRKFISKEHESVAMELRLLIRQIPHNAWENPLSMEWNRFRTSIFDSFSSASSVIDASVRMIAQAYAKSAQTSSTVQLLLNEMAYWNSANKHVVHLQQMVTHSFRSQLRAVTKKLIDEDDAEATSAQKELTELLETFDSVFSISSRGPETFSSTRSSIWHTKNLTTILRCLFNSIRLFEDPRFWRLFEAGQKQKAKQLSLDFRSWLERCIGANDQTGQARLPKNLGIGAFNMILHNFMVSSPLFGEASVGLASKLIDYMLTSDDAPQPDEVTLTILISNSAKLRDAKVLRSALLAAHLSLSKGLRKNFDGKGDNLNSVTTSLLQSAVISNDRARMIALLDAARFASSHPRRIRGKTNAILDVAQISAQEAIMSLYPSLQIDRPRYPIRRMRIRELRASRKRERKFESIHGDSQAIDKKGKIDFDFLNESHVPAQFHPSVLVAALHLVVEKGKTGLAERIWRLWLRVIKRQAYEQGNVENYVTIRALTMLNRLYAVEVKRDFARKTRLKAYSATIDILPSSVGPRTYGAKRGHRLALSLRSKRTVLGWAYELRRNPNIDPQMAKRWKDDRSVVARKVTRLRYLQMRDFWSSNQTHTIVEETFENFTLNKVSPIPVSQVLPSERPDQPFYRSLLCVFRKEGTDCGCFDENLLQQDDSFVEFFRLINFDMETFGLEVPLDFRTWISKHDQLSRENKHH